MTETPTPEEIKILPEKKTFKMEISYSYQEDKESKVENSWFYHSVITDNLKKAVTAAKKHFTEMVKETGWTSKVKILDITEMSNSKKAINVVSVSQDELAPARTRKSTGTPRKSQTTRTRKTTTTRKTSTATKPKTPRKPRTTKSTQNSLPL